MGTVLKTIEDAERYLLEYSPEQQGGGTYTLGRMRELMSRLGNPQDDIPAVHVAGTSGKTSTAYYIRALLEAHGAKTGLTASPHITSITERVQLSGLPLPDDTFLRYLNEFITIIEPWKDIQPTYFELLIAFAFWVFKKERVDYTVVEVGLGGLLDATNTISSEDKICVITPIGLDHTHILGKTVEEIAKQKAGVIGSRNMVFSAEQEPAAKAVLEASVSAADTQVKFFDSAIDQSLQAPIFQRQNFALARDVVDYIKTRDGLRDAAPVSLNSRIHSSPPGRFEIYRIGSKTLVLDGAHNPQKLQAFKSSLVERFDGPFAWLVGFIDAPADKIEECIHVISNQSDRYIVSEFGVGQDIKHRRSVNANTLERYLAANGVESMAISDPGKALDALLQNEQRTLVVTGSLYLVSRLRKTIIQLATSQQAAMESEE